MPEPRKPTGAPRRKPTSRAGSDAKTRAEPRPKPRSSAKAATRATRKPNEQEAHDTGRRRATVRAAIGAVILIGLLFVFVYPTRTFLDQRADTNRARAQLELLKSENAKLAREERRLKSDSEIERRARAYGLVRPGERPFVIIPAPTTVPAAGATNPAP